MKMPTKLMVATATCGWILAAGIAEATSAPPELPHCDSPLASVMVGKMACKAASCSGNTSGPANGFAALIAAAQGAPQNVSGISDGIKDVLVTALANTGCFTIQDREQMDEIADELARAGKKLNSRQAEFLISGAVTDIEVSQKNSNFGGGLIPIVGGIGSKKQKASVSLDMKLVNVDTATVVASKQATASTESRSFSVGAGGIGMMGGSFGGFGGSFSNLKGTNLEAVTKDAIAQSVIFLVDEVRRAKGSAVAALAIAQASN
jgi:curli biogenesis system outer membrane secretion channel CsgG